MALGQAVKAEVRGRDLMSGLPKTVILAPEEVREAIEEQVGAIVDAVLRCLGSAPPELSQDLLTQGLHLVGGGGMLKGLDRRLSEETGLPVKLVDAPLECVVMGAGKCIENFDAVHDLLLS